MKKRTGSLSSGSTENQAGIFLGLGEQCLLTALIDAQ